MRQVLALLPVFALGILLGNLFQPRAKLHGADIQKEGVSKWVMWCMFHHVASSTSWFWPQFSPQIWFTMKRQILILVCFSVFFFFWHFGFKSFPLGFRYVLLQNLRWQRHEINASAELERAEPTLEPKRRPGAELPQLPLVLECDPLEHLLVINLEGDAGKARRSHVKKEFQKANLSNFFFWSAANFHKDQRLAKEVAKQKIPSNSKLANALSHREIYEMMLYERPLGIWLLGWGAEELGKVQQNRGALGFYGRIF